MFRGWISFPHCHIGINAYLCDNARNISNESGLLYLGSSFCFSGMSTGDVEDYALKQTDSCACPRGLGRSPAYWCNLKRFSGTKCVS